jgi:hypothetical protein
MILKCPRLRLSDSVVLGRLLHNEPYLIQAGLLDTLKRTQALDAQCQRLAQQNAELERTMIPDNRLN